jgi:competence protein ComEC
MAKSKKLLLVCVSFILGVYFGSIPLLFALTGMALGVAVLTLSQVSPVKLVAVWLIAGSLGVIWMNLHSSSSNIPKLYGQKVELKGVVAEEPDVRSDKTFLTFAGDEGRLLLTVARYPEFAYGDELIIKGKITEPKDADQPGEFSYKNYLFRYGIEGLSYYPELEVTGWRGNKFKSAILKIKRSFSRVLDTLISDPQASFLKGILIGDRRGIPQDVLEQFRVTGTTHLIAISGFNITIIATALAKALERFGRRASFVVSLFAIFSFVILTGASASVVRAGIMAALGLIALNIGRLYAITNALVLTAVVMLLHNPKILRFDLGFQLSFLALMGLVYLVPVFERTWEAPKFIKAYLYPTLAAQVFTVPLILYSFGQLSLVAPLTNLIVVPMIPLSMLLGFITGIIAMANAELAVPFAWLSSFVLIAILKIVDWTSKFPMASVNIDSVPLAVPILGYNFLGLIFVWLNRQKIWKHKPNAS